MTEVKSAAISSVRSGLSERMSILVRAELGIEVTLAPPSTTPKLKENRGELPAASTRRFSENIEIALLMAWIGFPAPWSLQLCPPEPRKVTSKRRLARACQVM